MTTNQDKASRKARMAAEIVNFYYLLSFGKNAPNIDETTFH